METGGQAFLIVVIEGRDIFSAVPMGLKKLRGYESRQ